MTIEDYVTARGAQGPDVVHAGEAYITKGPCYAGVLDGKLLGVAGVFFLYPDRSVGEGWAVTTDWGRQHARVYHRAVREGFRAIVAQYRPRRIHALVPAEAWVAIRWAMSLGFNPETPRLRGYGPQGEDFVLFAQFPEEPTDG